MTYTFTTSEYEFAHGHRPRGRGLWAFDIYRADRHVDQIFINDTFSAAKREVLQQLRERGFVGVTIRVGA